MRREVRDRTAVRPTHQERHAREPDEGDELRAARRVHDCCADACAGDVGGRSNEDGERRNELRGRRVHGRVDGENPQCVLSAGECDTADGRRAQNHQLGPPEHKSDRASPALAQVGVIPARLREGRRQFGQ